MSISQNELEKYLNNLLNSHEFSDYCPNGLQVDAGQHIKHIITGVTACEALIDEAITQNAQAILVHHGYFWKGEPAPLVGMKGKRIRKLMQHGISLFAYHLPLDAHPTLGNNAQLAKTLNLQPIEPAFFYGKTAIGSIAKLVEPMNVTDLQQQISSSLHRKPLHISGGKTTLQSIGICTGAAQDMLESAFHEGCDAFISGEISERTTHIARELGIDYFACGHHATEKGGIIALGNFLQKQLHLRVNFVDIDNPV